jgi:hypothetical protein
MNVLMVAYEFPPMAAGGVMRTVKFAKHLSRMGHQVHVLTPNCAQGAGHDATMMDELANENVRVHRTRSFEFRGTRWAGVNWRVERLLKPLAIPDDMAYWAVPAIPRAWQLVKRHGIDVVFTTSWPYSDHLVGLALKRVAGRPWVVDFRDPWMQHHKYGPREGRRHRILQRIERAICERADRVVSTTASAREILAKSHADLPAERFCTIRNGFDAEDFAGSVDPAEEFLIVHTGSFYGTRNPNGFFTGLAKFFATHPEAKADTKVVCLGAALDGEFMKPANLDQVSYIPWASHGESIRWMRRARALLLIQHSEPLIRLTTPGKVYEYMATGNHIIGINIHRGENEDLLHEYGNATVHENADPEGIAKTLGRLYGRYTQGTLNPIDAAEVVKRYSREEGVKQLAGVFDSIESASSGVRSKAEASGDWSYA